MAFSSVIRAFRTKSFAMKPLSFYTALNLEVNAIL